MEKERRVKYLSLAALIVAVLGLTVAFAAMSQTLTINGTATLDAANWDIHFENLTTQVSGTASAGSPVLAGTSITGIDAVITKPRDIVYYFVDIKNAGTIDAKIASIEKSELCTLQSPVTACDWDNNGVVTQEDINKVNDNISFVVMYKGKDYPDSVIKVNDTLVKGESKSIAVAVMYYKFLFQSGVNIQESTELPKRDLNFSDLSVKINYVQS